jgi:C-5 cytosine-specific DNA methylase
MSEKAICYDLYCGLGGWAEGFLAEGYECRGFDIEAHNYGSGGYPGTLVLRDVRSIHGSELKDATCIVGSSPCQEFSYRAMPWKRAKALPPPYLGMELFQAQFRIQREASEAVGRYIPMVCENVRGAQKWVGRARAHYGSYYLWGDVGMVGNRVVCVVDGKLLGGHGISAARGVKTPGRSMSKDAPFKWGTHNVGSGEKIMDEREAVKHDGSGWRENGTLVSCNRMVPDGFNVAAAQRYREGRRVGEVDEASGTKQGGDWFGKECSTSMSRLYGSKSDSRKAASALIAKIPFALAQHIARSFAP